MSDRRSPADTGTPSTGVERGQRDRRGQISVLGLLLLGYILLVLVTYLWLPFEQISPVPGAEAAYAAWPRWQLALGNAGIVAVAYGLLGIAGLWLSRRAGLPGIFRPAAGWRAWVISPLVLGVIVGVVILLGDRLFATFAGSSGFVHPAFPFSLIASATAGIGEEILFRLFVMGLWAWLLGLALRRWRAETVAWWIANVIGALAFSASHLPSAMFLYGVASPAELPSALVAEIFLLNGIVGLVAGARMMRDGLVAAVGIHFWADIVWHVLWPLLAVQ